MSQTNGGKFRFNPNLYAVGGSLSPKQTAVTKLSHQGWQSMFVAPWHLVWARLDRGEVDAPSGMYSDSRDSHRRLTGMVCFIQVLISIQSMILCEEPYLNEPGWANNGGTPKSIACESFSADSRECQFNCPSQTPQTFVVWWSGQRCVVRASTTCTSH